MGQIVKPRIGIQLNRNHPLAQGLLGCWLLNEGSGKRVVDLCGHVEGAQTWYGTPDWVADGLFFAGGDNESIGIVNTALPAIGTGDYSLVLSIKTSTMIARTFFNFDTDNPAYSVNTTGHLYIYDGGAKTASTGVITAGQKTSVAIVREGTGANQTKYYIDGLYDSPCTHADSIVKPAKVIIASDFAGGPTYSFWGTIYYIYLYNRALTASEIAWLHREPYAMFSKPSSIWFRYSQAAGLVKVIDETLQFSESISKSMASSKILNEILQLSESTLKLQTSKKIINETVQISESVGKITGITKIINEVIQIAESALKITGITKIVNEVLQISETLVKSPRIVKIISEVVQLSEAVLKKGASTKIVNETVQISESPLKTSAMTKIINETLQLGESIVKKASSIKIINETLQLAESVVKKSGIIRIVNETLSIAESILKFLTKAVTWRELKAYDSPITLELADTSAVTLTLSKNSTITKTLSGESPLND